MTHAHGEDENVSGVGREGRHKLVTSRGNKLEQKEGKIANKLLWNRRSITHRPCSKSSLEIFH